MGRSITVEQLGVGRYSVALDDPDATVASLKQVIQRRTNVPEGEL
jgi:hypothetical protein